MKNSPQRNLYQSESFTKSLAITFRVLKKYFPKISTKNKHDKKPLAMSFYPQLRASFIIWIIGCTTTCQSFSNPKTTGLQEQWLTCNCYQFVIKRLLEVPQARINTGFLKHFGLLKLIMSQVKLNLF